MSKYYSLKIHALSFNLVIFFSLLFSQNLVSQEAVIKGTDNTDIPFPWVGGIDACQFGDIDMNLDGTNDLMVFDRRGNRLLCFINKGIPNRIDYTYAPEFEKFFPKIEEWIILADYNNDNKVDIFTYSPGYAGMKVFKNVSSKELAFESVVYPYLTSFQGGGYVNILATNADYPAIVDVDMDGDLDIVTFWALGGFIELHNNQSMEKYGHADSLSFTKTDFCWGRVAENEENNELFLDTCLFDKSFLNGKARHRGATFQVRDFTGDGLSDCVLADVDYPNLVLLQNGGTSDEAIFMSQDTAFPSDNIPVRLFSMPVTAMVDVNNDGNDDMLVSPFDPNPWVTENEHSVWLYLNESTTEQPDYQLYTKSFLQSGMIDVGSVSFPVVADVNQDGLLDIIIGNYGKYESSYYDAGRLFSRYRSQLTYYQNFGTQTNPVFRFVTDEFAGLTSSSRHGLAPAFADIDLDGITDMLLGSENGYLFFVKQTSEGQWEIVSHLFQNINAGAWCVPQLFDIDEDGITDLLTGSENGKISFYKGSLSNQMIKFELVTDFLGNVDVTNYSLSYTGYSTPFFFKTANDELNLVIGSESGVLHHFDHIRGNLDGSFLEIASLESVFDTLVSDWDFGARSSVCVADLDHNGQPELICGNFSGGLQLLNGNFSVVPTVRNPEQKISFNIYPNPAAENLKLTIKENFTSSTEINIFSITGQLVLSSKTSQNETIVDISELSAGLYCLQISGHGSSTKKLFIKQ